jgi:hypothetical protein
MPSAGDRAHGGCLFGPRVRFPDTPTDPFYTYPMTSNTASLVLAAMVACSPTAAIVASALHAIARLKNWRILRDHSRRGCHLADIVNAVSFLHNLQLDELRDRS